MCVVGLVSRWAIRIDHPEVTLSKSGWVAVLLLPSELLYTHLSP